MKSIFLSVSTALLVSCGTHRPSPSTAQPFAVLYGARKAQWLSGNQSAIFSDKKDVGSSLEVETDGFRKLDTTNQKHYLVVRFCTHRPANAEDGSQMWRLMSDLKCPKQELSDYIASLDEESLELYAKCLDGSIGQFRENTRHYLRK